MNNNLFSKAKAEFEDKKLQKRIQLEKNIKSIYTKIPRIKEIDDEISNLGITLAKQILLKNNALDAAEKMRSLSTELLKEKKDLLKKNNYPSDFLDLKTDCPLCNDEGYVDGKICSCLNKIYKETVYRAANLPVLMDTQSFDTFNLEYYPDSDDEYSPRKIMGYILQYCKSYSETFGKDSDNILMYGGTGLGKTFLSSCIAKKVIEADFSVYYQPAYRIFSLFESNKFTNVQDEATTLQIKYIFDSDLLIIDDLGTELVTTYTAEVLFDLINTRINSGKKTIINSNLNLQEIETIYSARISSRLIGNYTHLEFVGDDIRKM